MRKRERDTQRESRSGNQQHNLVSSLVRTPPVDRIAVVVVVVTIFVVIIVSIVIIGSKENCEP